MGLPDKEEAARRLIVALDVDTRDDALRLVESLAGSAAFFKVGWRLFAAAGPGICRDIIDLGGPVFLDLKLHDIPTQAAGAVRHLVRTGAGMLTVHAAGGLAMMEQAGEAAAAEALALGRPAPLMVAVTVLTSLERADLEAAGSSPDVGRQVVQLARLARKAGLSGVVASAREAPAIRDAVEDGGFVIVTPGIRSATDEVQDQARVATPAEALEAGASYLVVGRPIIAAADPAAAADRMLREMAGDA